LAQDWETVIITACNARMGFLRGLKTWGTFGTGWQRRVDAVRREALAMASSAVVVSPAPASVAKTHGFWAAIIAIIASIFRGKK